MFDQQEYFINRELSWLKFNQRVLNEAAAKDVPLLERLRFIAITSSNLDEFFMIRVAGLKQQQESGMTKVDIAGLTAGEQLNQIAQAAQDMVKLQYRYFKAVTGKLAEQGICLSRPADLSDKGREWVEHYFNSTIYPVITPMALDASHPFPFLANRSLNLAVVLCGHDGKESFAVVPVPGVLPRIIEAPVYSRRRFFVFLEDIIIQYCQRLFQGHRIRFIVPFRITRNADLSIDEEDAKDLLAEVEKSLRLRKRGEAVRLELGRSNDKDIKRFLVEQLKITGDDVYETAGPLDLTCMMNFADLPGCGDLRYKPLKPLLPVCLQDKKDIFAAIRHGDILLHHPYESFAPVVEFIQSAANDPAVLAIKQTLYRVSGDSPIVRALALAAENGKQVTVIVELKARFDEEKNIQWARRLEEAGCHVVYGLVGLKTHAKIALVVRRENEGIKRYVHMGTGNYNDATARIYTDLGLFTCSDQFGIDASAFLNTLSGYSDAPVWNKLVVAPLGLRDRLYQLIDREIDLARAGQPARIIAKMNSLIDKQVMIKLYEASSQGVKIDLIIRGICGLRPGLAGISDNITVRSIVGRFLEHHRIFFFSNGGDEKIWLSSSDWMPRNLNDRVELMFPVDDDRHIERIRLILEIMLKDNQKAYQMKSDGTYRRVSKKGKSVNSQDELYLRLQKLTAMTGSAQEPRMRPLLRKDLVF
ncbi:RNA degradosome polyphosphate kinase|uniref:Polyphosphate kinase n=1 Tax=Dendrosporobacter quercicolus TaxID=146817 RepID=A0A1G9Z454_9FIRM|nr:RNA degradosome polyphosphate kinase [Dendrosporobacter quercicolus]NSL48949.1 RNA degradosome polyphosphate kinase [Dendrosporobacter quercicolus DSM 1736]SDN15446.1 polyphosphate kinase [Dendrosporobacter quercicolus]